MEQEKEVRGGAQGADVSVTAPAEERKTAKTTEERIVLRLRKCGHRLHHMGRDVDAQAMLACLSDKEKTVLAVLLKKVVDAWKAQPAEQQPSAPADRT